MGLQGNKLVASMIVVVLVAISCRCVFGDGNGDEALIVYGKIQPQPQPKKCSPNLQCLASCGSEVLACCIECLMKDAIPCFIDCGITNIGCMGNCIGKKLPPPIDS
ncbi:hypothetical protein Fot_00847 [Forsythia ovata]|uniref:Uncharacterized protein n=1 Tax=Forsythia ovata TaxID=205694 RepID=A0ABD1X2A6_9LAMI